MPISLHQFILTCLRTRWDSSANDNLTTMWAAKSFTPDTLIATAKTTRLAPLLYQALRYQDILSPTDLAQLQQAYTFTAWRNLTIFHELKQVLTQLQTQHIPCLVLKGAGLAEPIYDNIALRPLSDIDLLVSHDQVPTVLAQLAQLGFMEYHTEPRPGFYLAFENEIILHKPGQLPIWLEVHWSLFNLPYYQEKIDMAWFWTTAQTATIQKVSTQILGPEALLLHLCSHIILHHRGDELHWLHDIAEVIYHYQTKIDWSLLLQKGQAYDLIWPLQQVLPQMVTGWHAPVPATTLAQLANLPLSPMEIKVTNWLTADERPLAWRVWEDIASMPSWGHRWRYIGAYLFPTRDYLCYRHQTEIKWPWPFYYLYHWGRSLFNLLPFNSD